MTARADRAWAPRAALFAFLALTAIVHAVVAWCSPLQSDDWGQWIWSVQHAGETVGERALAFAATHYTMADSVGFALAHCDLLHVIATPLVGIALIVGVFTLAMRRLPRPDNWDDVLGVMLVSALIWIAAPRAGLVWFHRPYAASQVWTCALMVWVIAPFRCGWRVRGAWAPVVVIAALLAGTATRQLGVAGVVAVALMIRRTPPAERARWMWLALGAIAVGAIAGFFSPPYFELVKLIRRGFEQNVAMFGLPLREGGELVSLVVALVFVSIVVGKLWPTTHASPLADPEAFDADGADPRDALRWLAIWFGLAFLALFGPRYSEALLFAPSLALVAGALPILRVIARARLMRIAIVGLAVGVHVVAWSYAVPLYVGVHAEFRARMHALADAPPYTVATIPTFTQVAPSFMFWGEDWGGAAGRETYASDLFGLRDIELATDFRRLEENPHLEVKLEVTGVSDAQLRAAQPPFWGRTPGFERTQFKEMIRKLLDAGAHGFTARLAITNVTFPQLAGRPLLVAWYEHDALFTSRLSRSNLDANNRYTIGLDHATASAFDEAWIASHGNAEPSKIEDDRVKLQPMTAGVYATVLCNHDRCFAADVFVPRF